MKDLKHFNIQVIKNINQTVSFRIGDGYTRDGGIFSNIFAIIAKDSLKIPSMLKILESGRSYTSWFWILFFISN
jgi:hypothetical protein